MSPRGRLRKPGADPNATNYSGISPFHKAVVIPGMADIVEVMLKHGADPEKPSGFIKVITRKVMAVAAELMARDTMNLHPVDIYTVAFNTFREVVAQETALHMAVRTKGAIKTVKKLLEWYKENNTTIKTRDSMGCTALHSAILALRETLAVLVSAGADPTMEDNEGMTSIDYAHKLTVNWALNIFAARPPPATAVAASLPAAANPAHSEKHLSSTFEGPPLT
ncbi:hypothetical protein PT974_07533 [Cladobotryum mycophilum]|uniref:Ankyrin n=1 Tax=Cladobotryum mycophilum TaxID=491253 RepID=A0ABR0SPI4_9HYPO